MTTIEPLVLFASAPCAGFARGRTALDRAVEWKPIAGFPGYTVSNDGRVWSMLAAGFGRAPMTPRELKRCDDAHGYLRVYLRSEGRSFSMKIAWLVLRAFDSPRPAGLDACHNDGFRDNDVVNNLRWDTRKGNLADCLQHGTRTRGERVGNSTLTELEVRRVRALLAAGEPQSSIARDLGVAQTTISKINTGKRWGWLA